MSVSCKSCDLDGCVLELCAVISALFKIKNLYVMVNYRRHSRSLNETLSMFDNLLYDGSVPAYVQFMYGCVKLYIQ